MMITSDSLSDEIVITECELRGGSMIITLRDSSSIINKYLIYHT
jgi:hypothetical protein